MFKKIIFLRLLLAIFLMFVFFTLYNYSANRDDGIDINKKINSFTDCVEAGYLVLESYPEQCRTSDGRNFIRAIDEEPILIEDIQRIEIVADNLDIPWEVVFLPSGSILINERPGNILELKNGDREVIDQVNHVGEGGLLGMALHPKYEENSYIYLYLSTANDNRVLRYSLDNNQLIFDQIIIDNIPVDRFHNGGRIAFGPDGYLYISTGDAQNTQLSQDINSLAGKILRIDDEGNVPETNPFANEVYSYGHRNSQGLAWDDNDNLWSTEHGPTALDELNLIKMGKNYGWPIISGDDFKEGLELPKLHSGNTYTWAPSGMLYWDNSLFFAGLRGEALYEVHLDGDRIVDFSVHFKNVFGRLRNVSLGPDNMFYLLSNNTDGRGEPRENDDKLIKINPQIFR